MVIDAHTHLFPDALAERALQSLLQNAGKFAHIYGEAKAYTDGTAASLTASSKTAGIDISLVLPIATSAKPSHTINDFAAMVDKQPGLRSFGSVHPLNPERDAELERVVALGLRGIKLHPEYQQQFVDDAPTVETVRRAAALGLPVVFHAGEDIGMPPPVHCTPERVCRLCQAVPEAQIILAHMGGLREWEQVLSLLPQTGVWLDTSYSLFIAPESADLFADIIRAFGSDRVMFGTDSPWCDQTASLEYARRFLKIYGFSAADCAAILGGNAARLLRLDSTDKGVLA